MTAGWRRISETPLCWLRLERHTGPILTKQVVTHRLWISPEQRGYQANCTTPRSYYKDRITLHLMLPNECNTTQTEPDGLMLFWLTHKPIVSVMKFATKTFQCKDIHSYCCQVAIFTYFNINGGIECKTIRLVCLICCIFIIYIEKSSFSMGLYIVMLKLNISSAEEFTSSLPSKSQTSPSACHSPKVNHEYG